MIPTRSQIALWLVPLTLSLIAVVVRPLLWPLIAVDALIVALCLLDALLSGGKLNASREVDPVQAVGRAFPVLLRLHNGGRRALSVRVVDAAPDASEGLPVSASLPSGAWVEVGYDARVDTRGEHTFGPITVRWRSPLGLWERQRSLPATSVVRVYPSFAQLRSWGVDAKADERRAPLRVRRKPGGESEFERLRPYVGGDSYRHIDWKATARRGEFTTREFGQESNQNVIFMLDSGRMMSAMLGEMSAFDHALNGAVVMGQAALRHGDRVGLLAFDSQVRAWLAPKGGARTGSRLIRGTFTLFPSLDEPDYALALRHLAHYVRRRSLVVLLTAVVDGPNAGMTEALVGALARRHVVLVVWLRDPAVQALADGHGDDPYHGAAAAELLDWRERHLRALRAKGALIIDTEPDRLGPALLSSYLELKARRAL